MSEMIHPYTCAFCHEEIDKRAQVKVTTTQTGTLKFYHVTPDCRAAHTNELDRAHQIAMHDAWEDVDVDYGLHDQ